MYQELTVAEYLDFVGKLRGFSGAELTKAIDRVMGGWRAPFDRLIANLSRGYRQRVGLAQTLIHDPPGPDSGRTDRRAIASRSLKSGELIKSLAG